LLPSTSRTPPTIYHQAEFTRQAKEAAKTRAKQEAKALAALERGRVVAMGPDGKPLLVPDGTPMRKGITPRDAAAVASPRPLEEGELARLCAGAPEQKAARRRAGQLKWPEELNAEKE
jgi:hypothetical protein